jgi:uncharacterized protein
MMARIRTIDIVERSTQSYLIKSVKWCDGYFCKLRGMQFRRKLSPDEAIVLVHEKDTTKSTSIHMLFVFFPIAAIWIDNQGKVTSAQLAKPWHLYYASPEPARYVLEGSPDLLERIRVGDYLDFQYH